jgi:hypothetical protein
VSAGSGQPPGDRCHRCCLNCRRSHADHIDRRVPDSRGLLPLKRTCCCGEPNRWPPPPSLAQPARCSDRPRGRRNRAATAASVASTRSSSPVSAVPDPLLAQRSVVGGTRRTTHRCSRVAPPRSASRTVSASRRSCAASAGGVYGRSGIARPRRRAGRAPHPAADNGHCVPVGARLQGPPHRAADPRHEPTSPARGAAWARLRRAPATAPAAVGRSRIRGRLGQLLSRSGRSRRS